VLAEIKDIAKRNKSHRKARPARARQYWRTHDHAEDMARLSARAISGPTAKEIEVNGVRLQYVEQGYGEPMIFVHGTLSGFGAWEVVGPQIAKKYRFIAYAQRYFGSGPWLDEGTGFSVATHAADLVELITQLVAGPVHIVGWSYGGGVAMIAALQKPSLVRSLILYEPSVISVLPLASPAGRAARQDRAALYAPAIAASKAGDNGRAMRMLYEAVYRLPPGGFDHEPQAMQARVLENARVVPLLLAAPPPAITCNDLRQFARPTLVIWGEKTQTSWRLISEAVAECVPSAQRVVLPNLDHAGPRRDPAAFAAAVFGFLSARCPAIAPTEAP
jgi:pimeloyl-ACP methyl ester carboxylesterase